MLCEERDEITAVFVEMERDISREGQGLRNVRKTEEQGLCDVRRTEGKEQGLRDVRKTEEQGLYGVEIRSSQKRRLQEAEMMHSFVERLKRMEEAVDCFDQGAWYALVDFVTVYSREDIRFVFKNGREIRV